MAFTQSKPTNHKASDVDAFDMEVVGWIAVLEKLVRDVEEVTAVVGEESPGGDLLGVPQQLAMVIVYICDIHKGPFINDI